MSWVVMRSRTTRSMRGQPDPHLVLDEFADRADAPVGKVVLVVEPVALLVAHKVQQVGGRGEQFCRTQCGLVGVGRLEVDVEDLPDAVDLPAQLAVQLVAANPRQVVAAGSK